MVRATILSFLLCCGALAQDVRPFTFTDPAWTGFVSRPSAASPSYLLRETFEDVSDGLDNTWTLTGSVTSKYTPALDGGQSIKVDVSGALTSAKTIFAAQGELWYYFHFRPEGSQVFTCFAWNLNNAAGTLIARWGIVATASGDFAMITPSGPATSSGTCVSNTTYNVWGHYKKGSGANGVLDLWVSTTSSKPGSPSAQKTDCAFTDDIAQLVLGNDNGDPSRWYIFDNVTVSTSDITGVP